LKVARMNESKGLVTGFWIFTALFCLEMSFTAYYELLRLPEAAQAFTHLGFSAASFRVELSWAKVAGVAALLMPMVPARGVIYVIKEWAYAGFAINLVSALIAHLHRRSPGGVSPVRGHQRAVGALVLLLAAAANALVRSNGLLMKPTFRS
jgi:hypothetical protein